MLDQKLALPGIRFSAQERLDAPKKEKPEPRHPQPQETPQDTFVRFGCGSC